MTKKIVRAYIAVDVVCLLLAFYLPYLVRYNADRIGVLLSYPAGRLLANLWLPSLVSYTTVYLFWGMLALLLLQHYNLFSTGRELSYLDEAILVLKVAFFSCLPAASAVFFLQLKFYSRLVFALNALALFALLGSWRAVKRRLVRARVARGRDNLRVLIAGAGKVGAAVAGEMARLPYFGWEAVGYLDDRAVAGPLGRPVLGKLSDLETVVRQHFIDLLIVTIPSVREKVAALLESARDLKIGVRIVPDLLHLSSEEIRASAIGEIPLLEYHRHQPHGTDLAAKRAFDLALSGLGLLFLLPFLPLIALLIKRDGPGPVFYVSSRCGKNGRIFRFFKLRTMVTGAEAMRDSLQARNESDGPVFKMRNDPRVTRFGRFLRRYSIDELPQIWNVFKADMSLVGPRPPTPEEVKQYTDGQLRRLEIRPGITCLWQVKGRADLSFEEWMKWDLFYIENWSFWLDLQILLLTLGAVLKGKGAY
jgi:exopolysaccharide biosynthesis polyprenyl glycosylphosphotransferase